MAKNKTIEAYVSRDECYSNEVWVWFKPKKGNWKPEQLKDCDVVNYQRPLSMDEMDTYNCYNIKEFKKIFGITPKKNTVKKMKLPANKVKTFKEDFC